MSTDQTSAEAVKYWNEMRLDEGHSCPNVSLFRLLGYAGVKLAGKNVLELGFGANRGEDLLECQERGSRIYGIDINESYIEEFKKHHPDIPVAVGNAGVDGFPFGVMFDLIFHRDMVFYLTDDEISFHLKSAYDNLSVGGHLAFQFIENDLTISHGDQPEKPRKLNFDALKNADTSKMFRGEVNPLRELDIEWLVSQAEGLGFTLISTKTVIETYTPNESVFRVDRYLLLQK